MSDTTSAGAERFHRIFLLILLVAISAAFLATIQRFLLALVLAAVLAGVFRPLHRWLLRTLRGRENAAAALTVLVLLLGIVGPLLTFLGIVTGQALAVSHSVGPWISARVGGEADLLAGIALPEPLRPYREALRPYQAQILSRFAEFASGAGGLVVDLLAAATRGTVQFLLALAVTLYATFVFLKDGPALLARILYYMPLSAEEERRMVARFVSVSRATLKGTLVIGVVQGTLAGGAFAVAGVQGAAFWGTLMALLAIIPGGPAFVWVPAVVYLVAVGKVGAAVGLGLWCVLVVGTSDNVLRPMLVGKDTQMPNILVLLSTLGGLLLFGALGIVIGPLVAALFITIWDMYGIVFRDYLHAPPDFAQLREEG